MNEEEEYKLKYEYVTSWLQEIYSGEDVPAWEVTPQNVDVLYNRAVKHVQKQKHNELLNRSALLYASIYSADGMLLFLIWYLQ